MQLYLIHHRVSAEISSHRELDALTDELIYRTGQEASAPGDESVSSHHLSGVALARGPYGGTD